MRSHRLILRCEGGRCAPSRRLAARWLAARWLAASLAAAALSFAAWAAAADGKESALGAPPVFTVLGESGAGAATTQGAAYVPPSGDPFAKAKETETEAERQKKALYERLKDKKVTLNFKDADLENVIRIIAKHGGLNLIIPPDIVKGTVTLYLDDVPILVALDGILRSNQLTFLPEESGILRIIELKKVEKEDKPLLSRVHVPLNWVKAEDMKKVLEPVLKEMDGSVTADPQTNAIIVSAPPTAIERIQEMIGKLDIPDRQVEIETRFVEMNENATRDLGIAWDIFRNDSSGASPDNQRTVIGPDGKEVSDVKGIVDSLDLNTAARKFPLTGSGAVWSYGFAAGKTQLGLQLQAFEQRGDAQTLANPRVTTLNNIPANINLTRDQPYEQLTQNPGGQTSGQAAFKEIGVNLIVTPTITDNGYVRLNVKTKQSILVGFANFSLSKNVPVVDKRESETNVIVRDENTAGLFGLRKVESLNSQNGVPWLHRIPFLGWLFKTTNNTQTRTDLALFLTPHILKDPKLAPDDEKRYSTIDKKWHLPDYFFDDVSGPSNEIKEGAKPADPADAATPPTETK